MTELDHRVAIVTGAGRGIGRAHALALAERGFAVVVNDLGSDTRGGGSDLSPAQEVVAEIRAMGGQAVVDGGDVGNFGDAEELVNKALWEFGRLDVVVNNAGILRNRTIAAMTEDEWDDVLKVHLKGTFAISHFAASHWRTRFKETGEPVGGRLINTTSAIGLYGNFGQANYGAAKAGIASFTQIAALELKNYGVTVNAVAPGAATRLTEGLGGSHEGSLDPVHIANVVAWLAGPTSSAITGRVFDVVGTRIGVSECWRLGPSAKKDDSGWSFDELEELLPRLVAEAAPNVNVQGLPVPA